MNNTVLRRSLLIIGLLFIGILLYYSWHTIVQLSLQMDFKLFTLSLLIATLMNMSISHLFKITLEKYSINLNYLQTYQLFFYSQLTKYIPGKIWLLLYQRAYLKHPQATSIIILVNIELMALMTLNVISVAILLLFKNSLSVIIYIFLCAVNVFFLYKDTLNKFLRWSLQKFPFLHSRIVVNHTLENILILIINYSIFTLTYLISYFLLLIAVFHFSILQAADYIALLGIAWFIGVISFIIPLGMGIRELTFILLSQYLSSNISIELISSIAIISRFWAILQEAITILLTLFLSYFSKFFFKTQETHNV